MCGGVLWSGNLKKKRKNSRKNPRRKPPYCFSLKNEKKGVLYTDTHSTRAETFLKPTNYFGSLSVDRQLISFVVTPTPRAIMRWLVGSARRLFAYADSLVLLSHGFLRMLVFWRMRRLIVLPRLLLLSCQVCHPLVLSILFLSLCLFLCCARRLGSTGSVLGLLPWMNE